ncbi:MAG: hypothetical protein RBR74_00570 [Ignavibacteriaceae bacterium]|jgi:hypothetical protein|nr:hypothetical protein [Ignavibacteriaceae bacterium]
MKTIFLLFILSIITLAQSISDTRSETITRLLVSNSPDISEYISPKEFESANRFGISYKNIDNKFFIANEFPKIDANLKYDYKIEPVEDDYYLLTISIPSKNISKKYYLKDSSIVSNPFFYSRNWKTIESDHFKFFISDKTLFNDYSIKQLEIFINRVFNLLKFSEEQINKIKQKKIYYYLCKDESEIQKLTGFVTRGMYILAQDYIVTTYNTHYHELVHFLINFKLGDLPLFTHPFFQEGLAVALGGRGGLSDNTILETGIFIIKSGFADYAELLNRNDFLNTDPSISYSVSGLYSDFLILQTGIEKFIELYKLYSTSDDLSKIETIDKANLPSEQDWNLFVDSLSNNNSINVSENIDLSNFKPIIKKEDFEIYINNEEYLFRIKDTLLISSADKIYDYQSKLFYLHFPKRLYQSEKYLIIANQNEISVYNLYSNNLIGKYAASFSIPPKSVTKQNDFYEFLIRNDLFDEDLKNTGF